MPARNMGEYTEAVQRLCCYSSCICTSSEVGSERLSITNWSEMSGEADKIFCTIDRTNKSGDAPEFDLYQFWLDQRRRRLKAEAAARRRGESHSVARRKTRLI